MGSTPPSVIPRGLVGYTDWELLELPGPRRPWPFTTKNLQRREDPPRTLQVGHYYSQEGTVNFPAPQVAWEPGGKFPVSQQYL